jgi:hypothetical protein
MILHADQVKGDIYLYSPDAQGIPVLRQSEVVFPSPPAAQSQTQEIQLTRRMLFGPTMFPNTNPHDRFTLRLSSLRTYAAMALGHMGLVPA